MRARERLRGLNGQSGDKSRVQRDRGLWTAIAVGVLVTASVGGYCGLFLGPVIGLAVHFALRRVKPVWLRRARARDLAELPFGLDVFASCLRAGAPLEQALGTTAGAVNHMLAERFRRAARALGLGATVTEAMAELDGVVACERVTAAICRSAESGAMLADGLALLAGELRSEREQDAQARAHRAGVWMVLPLCLCFLPAFILAGLVPVVISSLAEILNTY